jgi:SAM-dependent methyltransferase
MAHEAQARFFQRVKDAYPEWFEWVNVVEMGSLNINGTVRDLFSYANFVGFDVGPGPGVDYVVPAQNVRYRDGSFDTAISAECFEHNPYWKETFLNMVRLTRHGGLVTFTCAGKDRPEHGTARTDPGSSPHTTNLGWNYYRNLEESDFDGLLGDFQDYEFEYEPHAFDLYFWGIKR